MVKTMAKLRMAHASTHGARKPPGPKDVHYIKKRLSIKITFNPRFKREKKTNFEFAAFCRFFAH